MSATVDTAGPDLMTAAEVALKLRVRPWFVTERCRSGAIRATKPGKTWLISAADFAAYLERHANRPADEEAAS